MKHQKPRYARSTRVLQARLRAAGPEATWAEMRAATGLTDAGLARLVGLRWTPSFRTVFGPRGVNPKPDDATTQGAELTPWPLRGPVLG